MLRRHETPTWPTQKPAPSTPPPAHPPRKGTSISDERLRRPSREPPASGTSVSVNPGMNLAKCTEESGVGGVLMTCMPQPLGYRPLIAYEAGREHTGFHWTRLTRRQARGAMIYSPSRLKCELHRTKDCFGARVRPLAVVAVPLSHAPNVGCTPFQLMYVHGKGLFWCLCKLFSATEASFVALSSLQQSRGHTAERRLVCSDARGLCARDAKSGRLGPCREDVFLRAKAIPGC